MKQTSWSLHLNESFITLLLEIQHFAYLGEFKKWHIFSWSIVFLKRSHAYHVRRKCPMSNIVPTVSICHCFLIQFVISLARLVQKHLQTVVLFPSFPFHNHKLLVPPWKWHHGRVKKAHDHKININNKMLQATTFLCFKAKKREKNA